MMGITTTCEVRGCMNSVIMGWQPKGIFKGTGKKSQRGFQICKPHALRHRDSQDSFDLFEMFGCEKPIRKLVVKKTTYRCACGRDRLPGRSQCKKCIAENERRRKKRAYHEGKNCPQAVEQEPILKCKACGRERERGHIYCPRCAERRKTITRRQAQSRYWRKLQKC